MGAKKLGEKEEKKNDDEQVKRKEKREEGFVGKEEVKVVGNTMERGLRV